MNSILLFFFWFVLLHMSVQGLLVLGFVRALRRSPAQLITDQQSPRAVVILCLRGTDPFLGDCLRGLLTQDYPNYEIRIVIDHPADPSHAVVTDALAGVAAPPARIEFLAEKLTTCSLKCSSLVQVARDLDASVDFIAQIDADTVAHPQWLRQLATALQEEGVGAATGNRWYMPHTPSVGALVRYTWNAAAIVQMYWYRVAWGGTLAVKTRVLRETDVLKKWSHAFCEDTMLYRELKPIGLRVAFVPQLMMINREGCRLGGFYQWVKRQLLTARLYHPAWPGVVLHGVVSTLIPIVGLFLIGWAFVSQNFHIAWQAGLILGIYQTSLALLLLPMEGAVRGIAAARGEPTNWLSPTGKLKCLAIMPLTQLVYAAALGAASFMRRTHWRGIDYTIERPSKITMQGYSPYQPETDSATASHSL